MSEEISNLEPKALWEHFYRLTQIPRPSKQEGKAIEYIKSVGMELGLEVRTDTAGNIVLRKPASPGLENRKGVILQAHIDMVPQANTHSPFNFATDPIDAWIDGEWVKARQTTLGADNGIGVAAALATLHTPGLVHGPLEVLLTVNEEAGMDGAWAVQPGFIEGDILINLDSEHEDVISVGCAGGVDINFEWQFSEIDVPRKNETFLVSISGLKGGHSGLDIHLGRGNACKMMGLFLKKAISKSNVNLVSLNCGNMRNAIPREAFAQITVPGSGIDYLQWLVAELQAAWMNELGKTEPDLSVKAVKIKPLGKMWPLKIQDDVVNAMCGLPNGIIRMSDTMPGVVESSTNFSIIRSVPGKIEGMCLARSFVDSARDDVASSLESCLVLAGAKVTFGGEYPGWKPDPGSGILQLMKSVFEQQKGKQPQVVAMHAGLECGILGSKFPSLDMISVGPTIRHPHSPDEKVHIGSVERFWNLLLKTLQQVPEK